MNTNCLEGMRCPGCRSEGPFQIQTVCFATVCDDGIEETVNHSWDGDDYCYCLSCEYQGDVDDFRMEG